MNVTFHAVPLKNRDYYTAEKPLIFYQELISKQSVVSDDVNLQDKLRNSNKQIKHIILDKLRNSNKAHYIASTLLIIP